jgi:colicin import membrane protein
MAAMRQTADNNWTHVGAPERVRCKVRFTQLPGGEVIKVEFIDCPYDDQGRDFVDRALRKTPMPYQGFDKVFIRSPEITFCHPIEECPP